MVTSFMQPIDCVRRQEMRRFTPGDRVSLTFPAKQKLKKALAKMNEDSLSNSPFSNGKVVSSSPSPVRWDGLKDQERRRTAAGGVRGGRRQKKVSHVLLKLLFPPADPTERYLR